MASILIVEDHPYVREGVRSYLERHTNHFVCAECATGLEALEAVKEHRPELVLIDLRLPKMDGIEVIRRVHQDYPDIKMVVLTMHAGGSFVARAMRYGASGYLLKNSDISDLGLAVDTVLRGGSYFSKGIEPHQNPDGSYKDKMDELTAREREVLQLVAEGRTASEIKELLFISVRTAEKHRSNLMKKLGLHSNAEVIRFALRRGLIPLVDPGDAAA